MRPDLKHQVLPLVWLQWHLKSGCGFDDQCKAERTEIAHQSFNDKV
jgi:hypothetical protein